jgi:hypothetical protein
MQYCYVSIGNEEHIYVGLGVLVEVGFDLFLGMV